MWQMPKDVTDAVIFMLKLKQTVLTMQSGQSLKCVKESIIQKIIQKQKHFFQKLKGMLTCAQCVQKV